MRTRSDGRRSAVGSSGARPDGLAISDYSLADSAEALDLERRCAQGRDYRVWFRRETYHRRAENFREWRILTARLDGELVGTIGAALKHVLLQGTAARAAFLFDLRVHPRYRKLGIARCLAEEILTWALSNASFAYTYVVDDNRVTRHLARVLGATVVGEYAYLVYPTYRSGRSSLSIQSAGFADIHESLLMHSPAFDFYSDPACRLGEGGYVESWMARRGSDVAGCSAWSNRGILGEVVERIPFHFRLANRALLRLPANLRRWPHIPQSGEELRSWYVFDFFATSEIVARELMRGVETEAVERGIDYCYLVHTLDAPWVKAVRADLPRMFAPTIRYRLLAVAAGSRIKRLGRVYVDIRDL